MVKLIFEGTLVQHRILKNIFDAIKDLINEAYLDCSGEGISFQAMDPSHVCCVAFELNVNGFYSYSCNHPVRIGINVRKFSELLHLAQEDELMTLRVTDENSDKLIINLDRESQSSEFQLKLVNLDVDYLEIPESNYTFNFKIPSLKFQHIFRTLAEIGEIVTICPSSNGPRFRVAGMFMSANVFLPLCKNKPKEASLEVRAGAGMNKGPIKCAKEQTSRHEQSSNFDFALKYVLYFVKATPLAKDVSISLDIDLPLFIEYKILNTKQDKIGSLRYYLAPNVFEEMTESSMLLSKKLVIK